MPSLSQYKNNLGNSRCGEARKMESDLIEEYTFSEDINYRVGYFYDYYLDDEKYEYVNLHPSNNTKKSPIEIKFIANGKNSEGKDQVGYLIQFKPSFRWENDTRLSWYSDRFVKKYDAEFPIGCYVDIPDEKGVYRKWLITEEAGWLNTQFPTWYALPCDYIFRWVYDNKLYNMCGVSRGQNSYNSGLWTSRGGAVQTTIPENQKVCLLPMNPLSSTLTYDQRVAISEPVPIPIIWECSKVDNTDSKGISRFTFSQTRWNEHTDAFWYKKEDGTDEYSYKYDDSRHIYGIYANYYSTNITPIETQNEINDEPYGVISWNAEAQLKVGGSFKKFTVNFFSGEEPIIPITSDLSGTWSVLYNNTDAVNADIVKTTEQDNIIKIKFNKDDSWIGEVLQLKYTSSNGLVTEASIEIVGL